MRLRSFEADDLRRIVLQPAQAWLAPTIATPAYLARVQSSEAYTVDDDVGVLAIGALATLWPRRREFCALLSDRVGTAELLRLHRLVDGYLEAASGRIEATVEQDFEPGHRWMNMLGFTCETPHGMVGYLPDGRSSYLYARYRP